MKTVPLVPVPDPDSAPFFTAAATGAFVLPRCEDCTEYHWYPSPRCPHCGSFAVGWDPASPTGVVYSYTVVRHPVHPALVDDVPYVAALVEFPDASGIRLLGEIVDVPPDSVQIGMAVRPVFVPVDDFAVVRFTAAGNQES